jgi:nitrate/nitrite-specific signal transduction histidine kinase
VLPRQSIVVAPPGQAPVLRVSLPVANEPACYTCHDSRQAILGVLIADFSLTLLEQSAVADLQRNLGLSVLATALICVGIYGWVHQQIVRRVERLQRPIRQAAHGGFSERVRLQPGERDELGQLAGAVNRMADDLSQQADLERRVRQARHEAVLQERQRLARELHDGLAQTLGYVTTTIAAIHLMLRGGRNAEAAERLQQLEQAVQGLFNEVRQAILDLKTTVNGERAFVPALNECLARFHEQSGIPADLRLGQGSERLPMPPE